MFQARVAEIIKTSVLWSVYSFFFFRKLCRLRDDVGKYDTARQATYDNTMRRMRSKRWVLRLHTQTQNM